MFRSSKDVQVTQVETVTKNPIIEDYYCDLCEQGPWATETDLNFHRRKTHRWYILNALKNEDHDICSLCLHDQEDKQTLIEHVLEYHLCSAPNAKRINQEIFICDHCHVLFFNKQLLICHMYYFHILRGIVSKKQEFTIVNCPKCMKSVYAKSTWFHILYHGCYNIGTCPICLKICDSSVDMIRHAKNHKAGHFLCGICTYQTTKEVYFTKHREGHKKAADCRVEGDVSRFFVPRKVLPSMKNRMFNIFKGIPLTNQFSICVLCRELCFSKEQMIQHIYGDHAPEQKVERKMFTCACGEQFFNNVLLKHHIFKLKGNHRVWDGVTAPTRPAEKQEVIYQVYEISEPVTVGLNEIVISAVSSSSSQEVGPAVSSEHQLIVQEFEQMES